MIRVPYVAPAFVLLLLSSGCADALPEITDIDGPRTLGVSVHVVGDGERASPAPGETIHVEFSVADRGPRLGRSFAMVICADAPSDRDVGVCAGTLPGGLVAGSTLAPEPSLVPSFEFVLPDAATLGDTKELLVHGAICVDGELADGLALEEFPTTFETDNPCVDPDDEGEYVVFRIPLERISPNHRPRIEELRFDDEPWVAVAAPGTPEDGCVGAGLPTFASGDLKHRIAVTLDASAREAYATDAGEQKIETPFVAFHATEGDFEGAYAIFGGEGPREMVFRTRNDDSPRAVPESGRLTRFVFVVRDGRGGSSFVERAICLVPSP